MMFLKNLKAGDFIRDGLFQFSRIWQNFIISFLIILAGLCLPTPEIRAQEPLIEIEEAVWTDNVVDRQYQTTYTGTAPDKPLFFWTRVKGYKEAYDFIKKNGRLPILHKWYGYIGTTAIQFDKIDVGIGHGQITEDELKEIDWEFAKYGWFDWRTWSRKINLAPYLWQVEVVYPDGTPILDKKKADQKGIYEIKVVE